MPHAISRRMENWPTRLRYGIRSGTSVRCVSVVFRLVIQPNVQPGNTGSRRAEPNGLRTEALLHRLADEFPQRMPLRVRSLTDKCRQVSVGRRVSVQTRNHNDRVSAEIGKRQNIFVRLRSGKVLRKCLRFGPTLETLGCRARRIRMAGWRKPSKSAESPIGMPKTEHRPRDLERMNENPHYLAIEPTLRQTKLQNDRNRPRP